MATESKAFTVVAVPCLEDNYAYLVVCLAAGAAAVVDAVNPDRVVEAINNTKAKSPGIHLKYILTTHKHGDHSGGNAEMARRFPGVPVVGGKGDHVPAATMEVEDGQVLELGHLQIRVLQTPCHTRGHVLYFVSAPGEQQPPCLFSGDTLFIAGCGRFFEGSAQDMFTALCVKVARLPDSTLVYCGHEYTVNNLKFAASVEPDNEDVKRKLEWSMAQRQKGLPTIPSTLAEEKRTNPFMRVHELAVVAITNQSGNDPVAVMKELRARKDAFGLGSGPRL